MSKLKGNHALITGGGMGIGRLMAERCVKAGAARVILWDINREAAESTAQHLRSLGGAIIEVQMVDVSDPAAVDAAAAEALSRGPVDAVFNNAGVVVGKPFWEHSAADVEKTIRVNVLGVMHVARAFLPEMVRRGSGRLVNIASAAGLMAVPFGSVYSGSKWAVLGWSESVRLELDQEHPGVKVTTICPSYINTGMFDGVKAPLLTPILDPTDAVNRILNAVEREAPIVRMPWIVNTLPMLKGLLPVRVFDFIAGRIFGVYTSMGTWKGH